MLRNVNAISLFHSYVLKVAEIVRQILTSLFYNSMVYNKFNIKCLHQNDAHYYFGIL